VRNREPLPPDLLPTITGEDCLGRDDNTNPVPYPPPDTKLDLTGDKQRIIDNTEARGIVLRRRYDFITVYRPLILSFGLDVGVYLNELINMEHMMDSTGQLQPDGSFYMTYAIIQKRLGIDKNQQYRILKRLRDLGIVRTELRDTPARNYFTIDYGMILVNISDNVFLENEKLVSLEKYEKPDSTLNHSQNNLIYKYNNISLLLSNKGNKLPLLSNNKLLRLEKCPQNHTEELETPNKLKLRIKKSPIVFKPRPRKGFNPEALEIIYAWNSIEGVSHLRLPPIIDDTWGTPSKTFLRVVSTIKKVMRGRFFTTVGLSDKEREYTKNEILFALDRFRISVTSPNYHPQDKMVFKNFRIDGFFYNPYATHIPSQFLKYLEEEPQLISSGLPRQVEKNPQLTKWLKEAYFKKIMAGQTRELSYQEENKFIKGANLLHHAIRRLHPKLNMMTRPIEWCDMVIDALIDRWERGKVYPGHISSEYTYSDVLVRYLRNRGRLG
jgi:hypothetical protein